MARRRRVNHHLRECRERKYRLRGRANSRRFIPDADSDFAHMARQFANRVAAHAQRFSISPEQVAKLNEVVETFREALSRTLRQETAGPRATAMKNKARAEAEKIVRAVARSLRGLDDGVLSGVDRLNLSLAERPQRLKARSCPQIAPVLRFVGATHGWTSNSHGGVKHILEYRNDFDYASSAKPHGVSRLELFVELVPPELAAVGKVPRHPGELSGGRLWYVRSYTMSRFEVEFPVLSDGTPMLVVYWGRWADARGNVGPFSKTCVTRVEGRGPGMPKLMRFAGSGALTGASLGPGVSRSVEAECVIVQTPIAGALPDHLAGDEIQRDEFARQIAGIGQRVLQAATTKLLEAG